jgi:hypothetical protein
MTAQIPVVPAVVSDDERWAAWRARGAVSDRRTRAQMRWVAVVVGAALFSGAVILLR